MAQQPVRYFGGNALQTYFDTARNLQTLEQGSLQNRALSGQVQQQESTAQRREAAQAQATSMFKSKSPEQIADFLVENPEMTQVFDNAAGYVSERSKQSKLEAARNTVLGANPDEELAKSAQVIMEEGGDPKDTMAIMDQPEQVKIDAAKQVWAALDPTGFKSAMSATGKAQADLPAETRAFNDLIKDMSPENQKSAKLRKAGLKGRAISSALMTAIDEGRVTTLAEAKAEIKQAEKFGEMTATSRAKTIDSGFDAVRKLDVGIKNIDDAIRVIEGGAGVGAIEKLWPSIKASSIELDNIRGRMALDIIGSVTFGALSKGELDLSKDIALPTGLNTNELLDYLSRRKAFETKKRDYYNEQIQFLDQGGTVSGFLRKRERDQEQGQTAPVQQQAAQAEVKTINWGDM